MLELRNITKDYMIDKTPFPALKGISLFFRKKEFCCILGPSGCGKTTLLNIIGGLDRYTDGDLLINDTSTKTFKGRDWDNYRNKRIGFVFQNYNLIPHLSILENVELSLTLDGASHKERKEKAIEALKKVGLDSIINKKPNQLSGGQMQRVAIARALINDPEIILADEPTGALDSVTSTQVMDLIKELSKDRLVIMVTHNEELASKYATRIIKMKDGVILSDSNPSQKSPFPLKDKTTNKKKTSMNFFTALSMSLKNLFTKKGRTVLTSVAASFGIIGVALVLSLSNGFSNYVSRIENETASQTPINLPAYTSVTSTKDETSLNQSTNYPDSTDVYPYVNAESTTTYKANNFSENYYNYLNYLKDDKKLINEYIVSYVDSYSYNLITDVPDSINGNYSGGVSKVNYINGNYMSSTLANYSGLPSNYFHALFGDESTITSSYDVIEGRYPEKNNEVVLLVDSYNTINFTVLRRLGFYNSNDVQSDIQDLSSESKVKPLTWEKDIKNKKYKVFSNNDFYSTGNDVSTTDGDGHLVDLKTYNQNNLTSLYNDDSKGITLSIVGILRPKKSTTVTVMNLGICYLKGLQEDLVNTNNQGTIAGDFEKSIVLKDTTGMVSNNFLSFVSELKNALTSESITTSSLAAVYNKYFNFYGVSKLDVPYSGITSYLSAAKGFGCEFISDELKEHGLSDREYLATYISDATNQYLSGDYNGAIKKLVGIYAYLDSYSVIKNIVIFPTDLTKKKELEKLLDEWNNINPDTTDKYHAHNESEQIHYTDIASDLTSGIGQLITIISVVLIIFASISLIVSCVMTGIITYNSVLERTQEIGILRAVGARKKDVGRLFKAESTIIGGFSGVIGCVVAYLLTIPTNLILNNMYPDYNLGQIADLNIYHALILVAISILLTLISGVIPSRIAANKDPVTALRTE